MVNTTTAEVAGFVGQRAVKDLPLNGRSWDNLVALNPGAINYNLKSAGTTTSNGNTFTVAGRRPLDNLVLLNGIEYTGASLVGVTPGGVSGGLIGYRRGAGIQCSDGHVSGRIRKTFGRSAQRGNAIRHERACTGPFSSSFATAPWMRGTISIRDRFRHSVEINSAARSEVR